MLPLKLVRSLVLGDAVPNHFLFTHFHDQHHQGDNVNGSDEDGVSIAQRTTRTKPKTRSRTRTKTKTRTPLLLFVPTKELLADTYRLASLARDIGMDLYPSPSLSHIIFSWPPPAQSPSSSSSYSSSHPSVSWSSTSISSSWSLPNDAIPLPFPSLAIASLSHLRSFVTLSRGFFKLVFQKSSLSPVDVIDHQGNNWDCSSLSLVSRLTRDRIDSMDGFIRALAGMGWTLYKTGNNPLTDSSDRPIWGGNAVYLFRKLDSSRVRARQPSADGSYSSGEYNRIRELRLPPLDFRNAPLRILQYILLMTDDIFYLA